MVPLLSSRDLLLLRSSAVFFLSNELTVLKEYRKRNPGGTIKERMRKTLMMNGRFGNWVSIVESHQRHVCPLTNQKRKTDCTRSTERM